MAATQGSPSRLATVTALRQRYERALGLDLAAQTAECIDYLGHPEVLIGEFVDAFCQIDGSTSTDLWVREPPDPDGELRLEHFYADLEVEVRGEDPFGFVCVEGEIAPVLSEDAPVGEPVAGLDYAALVSGAEAPVLGAVQSERDRTSYQLLLRLLTCLAEVAPENQRKRLNHDYFKDALPPEPSFDLHLVVWDLGDAGETPLHQLTRDLCDVFMSRVAEEVLFPPVLRGIVCLRMDPDAFDGVVDFDWRA